MLRVVVAVAAVAAVAAGHEWGMGSCPKPTPEKNLSIDSFLGTWFVVRQTDTSSSCVTQTYTRQTAARLRLEAVRQVAALDRLRVRHVTTYTAGLDLPHSTSPAIMRVKWPLNMAGKADMVVLRVGQQNTTTGSSAVAVIFECQQISPFIHRKSASILARKPEVEPEVMEELLNVVAQAGLEPGNMDRVSHESCVTREDAEVKIDVDEETIKSALRDAAAGVRRLALEVAAGAGVVAETVSNFARRFGNQERDPEVEVVE